MSMRVWFMAAGVLIGMATIAPQPAHAGEGPWCAIHPLGPDGGVIENCYFSSIEQCRLEVVSGNRGWCGLNPRWPGNWAPQKRAHRRSRH